MFDDSLFRRLSLNNHLDTYINQVSYSPRLWTPHWLAACLGIHPQTVEEDVLYETYLGSHCILAYRSVSGGAKETLFILDPVTKDRLTRPYARAQLTPDGDVYPRIRHLLRSSVASLHDASDTKIGLLLDKLTEAHWTKTLPLS